MENSVGNEEFRYGEWICTKTYPQLFTVKILTMAGDCIQGVMGNLVHKGKWKICLFVFSLDPFTNRGKS